MQKIARNLKYFYAAGPRAFSLASQTKEGKALGASLGSTYIRLLKNNKKLKRDDGK